MSARDSCWSREILGECSWKESIRPIIYVYSLLQVNDFGPPPFFPEGCIGFRLLLLNLLSISKYDLPRDNLAVVSLLAPTHPMGNDNTKSGKTVAPVQAKCNVFRGL